MLDYTTGTCWDHQERGVFSFLMCQCQSSAIHHTLRGSVTVIHQETSRCVRCTGRPSTYYYYYVYAPPCHLFQCIFLLRRYCRLQNLLLTSISACYYQNLRIWLPCAGPLAGSSTLHTYCTWILLVEYQVFLCQLSISFATLLGDW